MLRAFSDIGTAYRRRAILRARFDIVRSFAALEESCIPSYAHRNPLVSMVAWQRLFAVARLWRRYARTGSTLDFGAGTGEVCHLIDLDGPYHFVETDETLSEALLEFVPKARRVGLENIAGGMFGCIFALDSLEHNEDVAVIIERLISAMLPDGVFIVSGPTENALYRLGRSIAGFQGHYHKTTIHNIETVLVGRLKLLDLRSVPFGLPLFRVSAWRLEF